MFVCLLNVKSPIPLTILRAKENRGLLFEMKGKGWTMVFLMQKEGMSVLS